MMKILFFIPSLKNSAGMERIATGLANLLSKSGCDCIFLVLGDCVDSFFPINEKIKVYKLSSVQSVKGNRFKSAWALRKKLKMLQPDVLINVDVAMIQIAALACPQQLGIKMISWEQFSMASATSFMARFKRYIAAIFSSKLVVLTQQDKNAYPKYLQRNIAVIRYFTAVNEEDYRSPLNQSTVIAVGRLCETKGFDLLIRAWKYVHCQNSQWNLKIIGGGNMRNSLQKIIDENDLSQSIKLLSPTSDIAKEYLSSSLFCLSSRHEPFGLVLIEAKSFGLPIVSFDCPYGPAEIVRNNKDGFLVKNGDVKALAETLLKLIESPDLRREFGDSGYKDYSEKYAPNVVLDYWIELLNTL